MREISAAGLILFLKRVPGKTKVYIDSEEGDSNMPIVSARKVSRGKKISVILSPADYGYDPEELDDLGGEEEEE